MDPNVLKSLKEKEEKLKILAYVDYTLNTLGNSYVLNSCIKEKYLVNCL